MTRVDALLQLESLTVFTKERLHRAVSYDEIEGVMVWLNPTSGRCKVGDVLGTWDESKEYYMVTIFWSEDAYS